MKIFVTGGTGLVGSHAIERLCAAGHDVVALVRGEPGERMAAALGATPVRGVVELPDAWDAARGADAIVHAAALVTTSSTWERYEAVNVEGARLAVAAAAREGARLVHISSVAVYGRGLDGTDGPVHEETPGGPIQERDYYARSKRAAEDVLWEVARERGVSAVALRPCVIYGERERLFMHRLMDALRWGFAPLVGSGTNRLSVVYVGSVIDALEAALARPDVTGPFNTTNDGTITQRQFFEIVGAAMGKRVRFLPLSVGTAATIGRAWQLVHRMLRPGRYTGVSSGSGRFLSRANPYTSARTERELGWRPSLPAHEALRRTAEWFVRERARRG